MARALLIGLAGLTYLLVLGPILIVLVTAFSPTDTPVLARWGKVLMMLQSVISLTVLALLAARAVNIL